MNEFTAQDIYNYLSNEWIKLNKKFILEEELLEKRKVSHKLHVEGISNPGINAKLVDDIGKVDLRLLERSNLTQKYVGCLSLIMTVIGIEGSESAKNIKEGVEKFFQENKHLYREMFELDKQISDSLLDILKQVLHVE